MFDNRLMFVFLALVTLVGLGVAWEGYVPSSGEVKPVGFDGPCAAYMNESGPGASGAGCPFMNQTRVGCPLLNKTGAGCPHMNNTGSLCPRTNSTCPRRVNSTASSDSVSACGSGAGCPRMGAGCPRMNSSESEGTCPNAVSGEGAGMSRGGRCPYARAS